MLSLLFNFYLKDMDNISHRLDSKYIYSMNKQQSIIHLLADLTESSQLENGAQSILGLQRCDSEDLHLLPEGLRQQPKHEKVTSLQEIKNEVTKESEKIFRLKLKMLGYANSLRVDLGENRDIRSSSFEEIFEAIIKKIKEISRASEVVCLQHYTQNKNQQIIILNLKTENQQLKEQLSKETNILSKLKRKNLEEVQKYLEKEEQHKTKLSNLQHEIFMANQLIKEQEGFIKELTGEQQTADQKFLGQIQKQRLIIENMTANQKVYENAIQHYQSQTANLLQSLDESQKALQEKVQELNANEEKLIAYYELFQNEANKVKDLTFQNGKQEKILKILVEENKLFESQSGGNIKAVKQLEEMVERLETQKTGLVQALQEKQKNIFKLNQQISEVFKNIRGTKISFGKKIQTGTQFPDRSIEKVTLKVPFP